MSEDELLYLVRCGNEFAFDQLFDIYKSILMNLLKYSFTDKTIVSIEDVYGDALSIFWLVVCSYRYDQKASFSTYAKECLKRRICGSLQKQYKYRSVNCCSIDLAYDNKNHRIVDNLVPAPLEEIPDCVLMIKESKAEYKATLSKREQKVYYFLQLGYNPSEIAQILKISLKSVYNAAYRGSKKRDIYNMRLTKKGKCDKLK